MVPSLSSLQVFFSKHYIIALFSKGKNKGMQGDSREAKYFRLRWSLCFVTPCEGVKGPGIKKTEVFHVLVKGRIIGGTLYCLLEAPFGLYKKCLGRINSVNLSRAWEEGQRELAFHGDGLSVWEDDRVLRMEGGEYSVNVLNAAELYALRWSKESIYVQCIIRHKNQARKSVKEIKKGHCATKNLTYFTGLFCHCV